MGQHVCENLKPVNRCQILSYSALTLALVNLKLEKKNIQAFQSSVQLKRSITYAHSIAIVLLPSSDRPRYPLGLV